MKLKTTVLLPAIVLLLASCVEKQTPKCSLSPADYVSTLVGTLSDHGLSTGNTYPATARPWGMNFWTPQTGPNGDGWTYSYSSHTIRGLKQTHQPSPWINDYGQFSIMPVRDAKMIGQKERASVFSHQSETAKPYYYQVYFADHDVNAELSATDRAAIFRLTFPDSETSGIVVDAFGEGAQIRFDPEKNAVVGYTVRNSGGVPDNFRNWFVVCFDKKVECEYSTGDDLLSVGFRTRRGEQVIVRAASSFISQEQAWTNLAEVAGRGFDEVCAESKAAWNDVLSRIEISEDDVDRSRTFYSCLFRSLLFPRKFHEIAADGSVMHYSPYNGKVCKGYMFTDSGFWDTFRALFPLLNLVYPEINAQIQEGLANTYLESGFLPEWASPGHRGCMVGNNSASIVADAILLGVNKNSLETLYEAVQHGTENVHPQVNSTGRLGHEYYNSLGYIPCDVGINENVARTLAYCYDDWCILQFAKKLGRPQEELDKWAARALNYRNVFDPSTSLMRGRRQDGQFQEPFSPYKWGDAFTEGNAWHYTWSVFHDIEGLVTLMGGKERFAQMLDSVFVVPPIYDDSYYGYRIHEITEMQIANMGNYAHGNQPAQHVIYLYDWVGQPWKTQYHAREVMDRLYTAKPDGYCGDEDNGQTSAWYVFSALGFYPVCPGSGEYALGSPLFRKAIVHLANGKDMVIEAPGNSSAAPYVSKVTLNGKPWSHNYLRYDDLMCGGKLEFSMSSEPCTTRGTAADDAPYSFSR